MSLIQSNISCFSCKKGLELSSESKITRSEECPYCYASIHCCKMCKFYDTSAYNECRETSADRILEKEKSNFCDYFILSGTDSGSNEKDTILSAANSLFKD